MKKIINNYLNTIQFLDNILFLDSIDDEQKEYNMKVDYFKKNNVYLLKLNVLDSKIEILKTDYLIDSIKSGSIIIGNIINLFTKKYDSSLTIDVKELDDNSNCIKYGRRTYNSKK